MAAARADGGRWAAPSKLPLLSKDTIHVWRLRAEARLAAAVYLSILQAEEAQRAERFVFAEDRLQSIASRATLRLLLAHYIGAGDPRDLQFALGEHGKPSLRDSDIRFNVSHTREVAVLAFGRDIELGVDVERVRATDDLEDVAAQNFAATEREALLSLPADERVAAFYRCWTRKEALVKADGTGLLRDLNSFAVPVFSAEPAQRLAGPPAGWELAHLEVLPDAPGAVAWRRLEPPPELILIDSSAELLLSLIKR